MTIKKTLLIILTLSLATTTYSQKKDFGIYYGIGGEVKLARRLEMEIYSSLRTLDNASAIRQVFLETDIMYKFNKFLSAGAGYRITSFYEDDESFHPRHRWYSDLKGRLSAGDFDFSARLRFQQSFKTYFENESDKDPYEELRFKLKALYNIPSFPVNPYLATEFFMPVPRNSMKTIDTRRYMAGAEYKISKKHSVELEYMYQHDFLPKEKSRNVVAVNYNFKF